MYHTNVDILKDLSRTMTFLSISIYIQITIKSNNSLLIYLQTSKKGITNHFNISIHFTLNLCIDIQNHIFIPLHIIISSSLSMVCSSTRIPVSLIDVVCDLPLVQGSPDSLCVDKAMYFKFGQVI